ncbi:MAG: amidohydrolase family protein [Lachnospiraceae bacterium]|nr:amidohydrolase family protein [Lachnospiraceae bacterium]
MIIDFHTHIFPDRIAASAIAKLSQEAHLSPCSDGTAAGLRSVMDRAGTDLSVILPVATSPLQVEKVNQASVRLNEEYEGRGLISFGCIHPAYTGYKEELKRIAALGMKGIKIHPVFQGMDIDSMPFLRILDQAAQLGLIVVTHAGQDIGFPGVIHASPAMCAHVVREIGPFPFVLAHMGGWLDWAEVPLYLAETGVFLDTSFCFGKVTPLQDGHWEEDGIPMLDTDIFLELIHTFGADHVLFGTDSPWTDQKTCLEMLRSLPLSEHEKKQILGQNAQNLLRLS